MSRVHCRDAHVLIAAGGTSKHWECSRLAALHADTLGRAVHCLLTPADEEHFGCRRLVWTFREHSLEQRVRSRKALPLQRRGLHERQFAVRRVNGAGASLAVLLEELSELRSSNAEMRSFERLPNLFAAGVGSRIACAAMTLDDSDLEPLWQMIGSIRALMRDFFL